ncbi:phosphopantetheine-binding protein [bacterium]|nr:phosphopantetheine-binding protein [bacterium]
MENLIANLKEEIIEQLNLEDLEPDEIGDDEPLFGGELGLDSIDALELIVMLEKGYGLKIESPEAGRKIFQSISSIASYIRENQPA